MNRKQNLPMSPTPEDLTILKDDMIAFIEGHGMRRFHGYVDYDEVQCVMWETGNNPDGWKDFVELAKSAGAPFLTMHSWKLEREELDELVERLSHSEFSDGDDVEDARWLRAQVGKQHFHRAYLEPQDGVIPLPTEPGLGIALDDAKIEERIELG